MIKKEEVTIEVDKMYCDVCGKEICSPVPEITHFEIVHIDISVGNTGYLEAYFAPGKAKKDICFNCLQKKINEAIEELYRK